MTVSATGSPGQALRVRLATPVDLGAIHTLLEEAELPLEGVAEHLHNILVGEVGTTIVAAAGVEAGVPVGLLRSVVVSPRHRGSGHGVAIVRAALRRAEALGVKEFYLLTTTAPDFFKQLGFGVVPRSDAPDSIRLTREFSTLCSESAVLMYRSA